MKLSQLSIKQAEQLFNLVARKESLLSEIRQLEQRIESFATQKGNGHANGNGHAKISAIRNGARTPGKRGRKGVLGESILNELKKAGSEGMTLAELAQKIGGPRQRFDSWFYMNANKFKALKKIDKGRWRLS